MTTPSTPSATPPVPALVRAYAAARYYWRHDGRWHAFAVGQAVPELERCYPRSERFGAISAWNPHSVQRAEAANRAADEALQARLLGNGTPFCPSYASAGNRTWREPGWIAMDWPVAEFDALLRRFGQLAGVWWTRGALARLRVDAAPAPGLESEAWVDWLR
ncbi:DUF3293 domain-containing protein [Luteimonas aquatica]|uniref:DUF3293 domain-containing protein n=1 Tax=Luteimonas aquatica TaxID=450364 RepID=UPI001F576573|nr:DUF3293 domain-containing protein [Luteimonas aquatica]